MPTWGQILNEIQKEAQTNPAAYDAIRKKYISELAAYTKRNLIIYASRWTSGDAPPQLVSINEEDIQAFMEAVNGLKGDDLDIMLHTPGGSAEATDGIVSYLRQKFKGIIRIIIPQAAMSAGTMLACAGDELIMAKHSFIGPIDPQFFLQTATGPQMVPAHAILEQFDKAKDELTKNPSLISAWLPMLNQYGPSLLIQCKNQIKFGKDLVESWLTKYMHKASPSTATSIANYLSDHANFNTHAKHLNIDDALKIGLKVTPLENDSVLQDKVLSAFHATILTFSTPAVKVVCNHVGNTFIKQNIQNIPFPIQLLQQPNQPIKLQPQVPIRKN